MTSHQLPGELRPGIVLNMGPNLSTLPTRHVKAALRIRAQLFRKYSMEHYGFTKESVISWHFGHTWESLGGLSFLLKNSKDVRLEFRVTHSEGDTFDLTIIDQTVSHTLGIRVTKFANLDERLLALTREYHDYQNVTPTRLYRPTTLPK